MVRPERFELPAVWFEARCSIQLSYGREALNLQEVGRDGREIFGHRPNRADLIAVQACFIRARFKNARRDGSGDAQRKFVRVGRLC